MGSSSSDGHEWGRRAVRFDATCTVRYSSGTHRPAGRFQEEGRAGAAASRPRGRPRGGRPEPDWLRDAPRFARTSLREAVASRRPGRHRRRVHLFLSWPAPRLRQAARSAASRSAPEQCCCSKGERCSGNRPRGAGRFEEAGWSVRQQSGSHGLHQEGSSGRSDNGLSHRRHCSALRVRRSFDPSGGLFNTHASRVWPVCGAHSKGGRTLPDVRGAGHYVGVPEALVRMT